MRHLREALKNLEEAVKEAIDAARRDDKTPLFNAIALQDEASKVGRTIEEADVLVFGDLNRFKQINDQYGHAAGDAVITHAGRMIHTLFVEGLDAQGFRKSGDEFVLLFKKSKLTLFQQQCRAFAHGSVTFERTSITFSMSFGYACSDDGVGSEQNRPGYIELMERAEGACQKAKTLGEGECVGWTSELEERELITLRRRCKKCNTTTSCAISKDKVPKDNSLHCPVCKIKLPAQPD